MKQKSAKVFEKHVQESEREDLKIYVGCVVFSP